MTAMQMILELAHRSVGHRQSDGPYGAPGRAWCAAALATWLLAVGEPVSDGRPRRGAKALGRDLADRHGYRIQPRSRAAAAVARATGSWRDLPQPKVGDVIVYHRGDDADVQRRWRGHIVLVVAVHADGSIETIGGNENPAPATTIAPLADSGSWVCHRRLNKRQWSRRLQCCVALGDACLG